MSRDDGSMRRNIESNLRDGVYPPGSTPGELRWALSQIDTLTARLSRYESIDASAPILDAASVAEFAGLARSVAASHERLRAQLESVEADKNRALQGEMKALRDAERDTAERIAAWVSSGSHCGSLIGENMAARIREGAWKAGPK